MALGLNLQIDTGWATIFRRLAHDLLPVDSEKFIEEVLESGGFWRPLLRFSVVDLAAILKAVLVAKAFGKAATALNKWIDRSIGNALRRARLKRAAEATSREARPHEAPGLPENEPPATTTGREPRPSLHKNQDVG